MALTTYKIAYRLKAAGFSQTDSRIALWRSGNYGFKISQGQGKFYVSAEVVKELTLETLIKYQEVLKAAGIVSTIIGNGLKCLEIIAE